MTFLGKYIDEHGELKDDREYPEKCPSRCDYEKWHDCSLITCKECWEREIDGV